MVAERLWRAAEREPVLDLARAGDAQAIVILAGGSVRAAAPEYAGEAAAGGDLLERLAYGAYLAHRTGLPVLVSGTAPETQAMQASLSRDFGVTPRWVENRSRDTFQNAQYSAPLLRAQGITRILLVTDALHEHRAAAEFAAAGLAVRAGTDRAVGGGPRRSRDATCRTSMRSSARRWHCMSCSATRRGGCLPRSACAASRAEATRPGTGARRRRTCRPRS